MQIVNPKMKTKYPYLDHLMLGSLIYFVEIDITELISNKTYNKYSQILKKRETIRKAFEKEEINYELFVSKKYIKIINVDAKMKFLQRLLSQQKQIKYSMI